jgi:hypothetical protein
MTERYPHEDAWELEDDFVVEIYEMADPYCGAWVEDSIFSWYRHEDAVQRAYYLRDQGYMVRLTKNGELWQNWYPLDGRRHD